MLGDSHAAGLGVRGRSYAVLLAERAGAELLQLARTTQTVDEIGPAQLDLIRDFDPDLVIVSCGAAESFVHPSRLVQRLLDRFAPRGWRGVAGLEPRPYFSGRRVRRLRQRVSSSVKILLKRLIIPVTGGYQRVPVAAFARRLGWLLDSLPAGTPVVLTGLWPVGERGFPRSNAALRAADATLREAAAARPDARYFATYHLVERWGDYLEDRAHLNDTGHARLATHLLHALAVHR